MSARDVCQQLWIVNNERSDLEETEQAVLIDQHCTEAQASRIMGFKQRYDQKNALLSHLLQRHACTALAQITPDQVRIERTKGKKPFSAVEPAAHCPNFNFNPSHDGQYVVLGASTHYLTGVDVHQWRGKWEFLENTQTASQKEHAASLSPAQRGRWAQALFSAKEAYTKALGVGLAQPYERIEFVPSLPPDWTGEPAVGTRSGWKGAVRHLHEGAWEDQGVWCLELHWVHSDHIVLTAAGDVARAVDAIGEFKSRLTSPGLCPTSVEEGSFGDPKLVCLDDLMSPSELKAFKRESAPITSDSSYTEADQSEEDVKELVKDDDLSYYF